MTTSQRTSLYEEAREAALGGPNAKDVAESIKSGHAYLGGVIDRIRVRAYYPPTRQLWDITRRVSQIGFTEAHDTVAIQGTATIDNSDGEAGSILHRPGMIVFLETAGPDMSFKERYRFVVWESDAGDVNSGTIEWTIFDHMIFLTTTKITARYGKDKRHPNGWTAHQIAVDICRKYKIPVRSLIQTSHVIGRFHFTGTIYDVLAKVYSIDTTHTHRQYFILMEQGKLRIRRRRKRNTLLAIDERYNMRSVRFSRSMWQGVAAKISPKGSDTDGDGRGKSRSSSSASGSKSAAEKKRAQRIRGKHGIRNNTQTSKSVLKAEERIASATLFGYVTYHPASGGAVNDPDYTRRRAQDLADILSRSRKAVQFQSDGNMLMRMGDRLFVRFTFTNKGHFRKELYISTIAHSITPGDYMMDVTCAWRAKEVAARALNPNQASSSPTSTGASSGKGQYSKEDLVALAKEHNFPDPNLAAAVAMAESSGEEGATHTNSDGSVDRGLWQINSVHKQYDAAKLLTADYNADAAFDVSSGGTNWAPWTTYKSGAYRQYL